MTGAASRGRLLALALATVAVENERLRAEADQRLEELKAVARAKYAHASRATVRLWRDNESACIEIADDGVGGADENRGSGLRGLGGRVEALDGQLRVVGPAGTGTHRDGGVPLQLSG